MRVRDRSPRGLGWWTRAWSAAVAAWSVVALLAVLPLGAGTVPQAHADSGSSAKTVAAQPPWIPATKTYGTAGTVTVSSVTNLTDQMLHVSWTGFTPSVNRVGGAQATKVSFGSNVVLYPVRVYECRGADPKITDCYGSTLFGGDATAGFQQPARPAGTTTPDLPSNAQIAVTGADGTGSADIEVWTAAQSPNLGCDNTHACSVVVEPNYGGDPLANTQSHLHGKNGDPSPACEDRAYDTSNIWQVYAATDLVTKKGNAVNGDWSGEACSWTHRTVVPLSFAPTPNSCAAANSDFGTAGSALAERAIQQWRTGACLNDNPINAGYTSLSESMTRQQFGQGGGADVGLVLRPDSAPATRPYVYTPLANSAVTVAFLVDDPTTGKQIGQMKLNARLLAKELTQSYTESAASVAPQSVAGNPDCLFSDPEFLALNPASSIAPLQWPSCTDGTPNSLPIVLGNSSDMIYQLTSWIAADPDASNFLEGQPDDWGMRVDPSFLRSSSYAGFPTDILAPRDSSGWQTTNSNGVVISLDQKLYEWSPVLSGLDDAVRDFLSYTPTCQNPNVNGTGGHDHCVAQPRGTRQLIAIMDNADAQDFSLPAAQLVNPSGTAVAPSIRTMQAAVNDMPLDPTTGTRELPYGVPNTPFTVDSQAYPLTVVQYAMAPTANLGSKSIAISNFLQQITNQGGGQLYGVNPGNLAPGWASLTPAQLNDAQAALAHVTAQDGAYPGNQQPPANPAAGNNGSTQSTTANQAAQTTPNNSTGDNASSSGSGSSGSTGADTGSTGDTGTTGSTTGAAPTDKTGAAPSASPSSPAMQQAALGTPTADRSGAARLLMPVVLIAGAVLLVGGPAALVVGGTAFGARVLSRLRRFTGGS
ncbi:hypothetical protein [Kitasatospora viridis]|uniref:PBP domain-containing protein n=1 Tax=Kitasatospora viridis TaxID=281105 RepID=A0A561UH21_9ACTN|nr:hypothetical protein [Kitasatospora viridis]TWF98668.1 hypothetical protein FHX73_112489 [Kitasatospora viridis]